LGRSIPVKPIDVNELFELNPDYEVVSFDGQIMIIDNWYKNYDQIIEVMEQQTPVYYNYVTSSGIQPDNGKKYHDCRVLLTNTSLEWLSIQEIFGTERSLKITPNMLMNGV
jgi:hypothetical protein